jgi:hypothetical protein
MAKKNAAIKDAADDNNPGACYITDKQSGEQRCHLLTETECTAQGGVFYGGPCGPFAEALKIIPKKRGALKKAQKKAAKKTSKKSASKKKRPE